MSLLEINIGLSKVIKDEYSSSTGNKTKIFLKFFDNIHDETILLNRSTKCLTRPIGYFLRNI